MSKVPSREREGGRSEQILKLPAQRRCSSISLDDRTVLILAAGFEDRRTACLQLVQSGQKRKALVLDYRPVDKRNDLKGMLAALRKGGFETPPENTVVYDRFSPHPFPNLLKSHLERLGAERVVLDISAMSKLAVLLCLDVLREMNLEVLVFYTEAKHYRPSRSRYQQAKRDGAIRRPSIQVYTGVHKVLRVQRLSSVAMQGQPTAAVAFMSFNEELTQALLNSVYPSRLFLINGRPPKLRWREQATAWIHDKLRQEWGEQDNPIQDGLPVRVVSTRNYRDTVHMLLNLYWRLAEDYRILLAPTGSKMQTVGCYFARALHPDIHIEYPTPSGYMNPYSTRNRMSAAGEVKTVSPGLIDPYSRGIGPRWMLRLGLLGDLTEELRGQERKYRLGIHQLAGVRE